MKKYLFLDDDGYLYETTNILDLDYYNQEDGISEDAKFLGKGSENLYRIYDKLYELQKKGY